VVQALKERGHHVTGWDINVWQDHNDVSAYLDRFKPIDVTREHARGEFDAVVHLAGLSVVPLSNEHPSAYYHVNIWGTNNMLDSVRTDHFLFASTSSAWEMASPYARSKVGAEDVIREKTKDYTIFRFFNVSGTNGEWRQLGPATHLIRVAAEVVAGRRECLDIYGDDYDTRDGTCIRDYVHVMDLADAICSAVDRGPARTPWECIGSNHGYSVLEVVAIMREVSGHAVPTRVVARRAGDAVASVVDSLSDLVQLRRTVHDMCRDQIALELQR
jgi:UDP-glucose 4-epimerase